MWNNERICQICKNLNAQNNIVLCDELQPAFFECIFVYLCKVLLELISYIMYILNTIDSNMAEIEPTL